MTASKYIKDAGLPSLAYVARAVNVTWPTVNNWYKNNFALFERVVAGCMFEWQPIETAPKDGTIIDIIQNGNERVTDVCWNYSHKGDNVPLESEPQYWGQVDFRAERMSIRGISTSLLHRNQATHWMPRPNGVVLEGEQEWNVESKKEICPRARYEKFLRRFE